MKKNEGRQRGGIACNKNLNSVCCDYMVSILIPVATRTPKRVNTSLLGLPHKSR